MKLFCILFLSLFFSTAKARSAGVHISFSPWYSNLPLTLESTSIGKDSMSFQTLRFYVSAIVLYHHGKMMWQEPDSYHLVDAGTPAGMDIQLASPSDLLFDSLHFTLGIDSITNAAGAGAGDLDATRGMYWAWQSGYINFKLEGRSRYCTARKHEFFLHLGGFRGTDACAQNIILPANDNNIKINMDLDGVIESAGLPQAASLMVPGEKAVSLSKKLANAFSTNRIK